MTTPASVRALRTASGLTQRQMADCLGLSYRAVQQWEGGKAPASPIALELFAIVMLARYAVPHKEACQPFIRKEVWEMIYPPCLEMR